MRRFLLGVIAAVAMICALPGYSARADETDVANDAAAATEQELVADEEGEAEEGDAFIHEEMIGSISTVANIEESVLKRAAKRIDEVDVDTAFAKAAKKISWKNSYTKEDLRYLSAIIYCEANGMSHDAQVAVGNVVLNRMRSSIWGHVNTIKEVIYDRKWGVQFSPTSIKVDKKGTTYMERTLKIYDSMDPSTCKDWEIRAMENCIAVAKEVMEGAKTVPDTYLYFNGYVDKSKASCEANGWSYIIIEGHIYFVQSER